MGMQISRLGVITAEPPYHAQVWDYPPQGLIWIAILYQYIELDLHGEKQHVVQNHWKVYNV